jgi:SAM-dependent methyltransferase
MLQGTPAKITYISPPSRIRTMDRPLYSQLVTYYELVEGRDWQSEIRLLSSVLKKHACKSIVDLGCGTGYHVRALSKLRFRATGIDISKHNIRFAKRKTEEERGTSSFVVGSYYDFHPRCRFDAAICLNWSIPVRNDEVKRFLDNTYSLLRPGGILVFDFEKVSEIVWSDVGKAITESWDQAGRAIVRVSVGQIVSNVLCSRDVYLIYWKLSGSKLPDERSRYEVVKKSMQVQTYIDRSCVRFFSTSEIKDFAQRSGFKVIERFVLPRDRYKRTYAVLKRVS